MLLDDFELELENFGLTIIISGNDRPIVRGAKIHLPQIEYASASSMTVLAVLLDVCTALYPLGIEIGLTFENTDALPPSTTKNSRLAGITLKRKTGIIFDKTLSESDGGTWSGRYLPPSRKKSSPVASEKLPFHALSGNTVESKGRLLLSFARQSDSWPRI